MNDNWQVITKSEKIMPPKTLMNLKSTIIISSFQRRSGFNCTLFNSQVISEAIIVLGKTFPLAPQQHQLKQEAEWETTRSKWIGNFVVFSREIFTKLLNSKCCSGNAFWPSALYSFWSSEIAQPQNWVAKKRTRALHLQPVVPIIAQRGVDPIQLSERVCVFFLKSRSYRYSLCVWLWKKPNYTLLLAKSLANHSSLVRGRESIEGVVM